MRSAFIALACLAATAVTVTTASANYTPIKPCLIVSTHAVNAAFAISADQNSPVGGIPEGLKAHMYQVRTCTWWHGKEEIVITVAQTGWRRDWVDGTKMHAVSGWPTALLFVNSHPGTEFTAVTIVRGSY